jgi:two-component system, LuxR family, response regulator FixJ
VQNERHLLFIVDDDEAVRASTRALLEVFGYAVRDFASAEQLIASADIDKADCLILDYHLPGMSGLEFVQTLRADGIQTPVIMVSAYGANLTARAAKAGVVAILNKPVVGQSLTRWLDQILSPLH